MKLKFLFSLLALTCMLSPQAQIKKDAVLLGGSIGYSKAKANTWQQTTKSKTFIFSPAIGVAIKENLVAGVRINYLKQTQNSDYASTYNNKVDVDNKNYGGGVFIRGYVPIVNRLYVFGEGEVSYTVIRGTATQQYDYYSRSTAKTKGWSTALGLTPGVSFGVSKKFQIESGFNSLFNVGFLKSKTISSSTTQIQKEELFSAGVAQNDESLFYVGFRFII